MVRDPFVPGTLITPQRMTALLELVQLTCPLEGDMAEVGVFRGGTAYQICHHCAKTLHLFDTWAGIPEDCEKGGYYGKGTLAADLDQCIDHLDGLNVVFHIGVFPESADIVKRRQFSFVHSDTDTYQGARATIEFFAPRMVEGGVIVFDDFDDPHFPGVTAAVEEVYVPSVTVKGQQAYVQF